MIPAEVPLTVPTWSSFYRDADWRSAKAKVIYYLRATAEQGEVWAIETGVAQRRVAQSVIAFVPPGRNFQNSPSAPVDRQTFLSCLGDQAVTPIDETTIYESVDHRPKEVLENSWMITLIGTVPEGAGKGLASDLIELVIKRAAKSGVGVCVPTTFQPRMGFYEKLGFQHIVTKEGTNDLGEKMTEYMMFRPFSDSDPAHVDACVRASSIVPV
ncbi:hypothetical protein I316_06272 [Kwoniella heveanensis BCC8398]|uniref:N-acetyltransferase domain-containing protein n=1 Tax=Kwoniella heveanensis BCC8398 TaxID=1296120 RepID=A0A1B9GM67_9TREE|nr:hypothetical protein I316_06272 [Kwoniella heveanensis BCC8398]